jgi:hypothetical protein
MAHYKNKHNIILKNYKFNNFNVLNLFYIIIKNKIIRNEPT